jgi:transaldolase
VSVTQIYQYYKHHDHRTEIMGASFRNIGEIRELAGCDLLTISPALLADLQATEGELPRKLAPATAKGAAIARIVMDRATFDRMHEADEMSKEKLAEGIAGFSKAIVALEKLLEERLARLEGRLRLHELGTDMFGVWDLDGDGAITREEWTGTDAVFDALDTDHDGKVTPEELGAGIGAAYFFVSETPR